MARHLRLTPSSGGPSFALRGRRRATSGFRGQVPLRLAGAPRRVRVGRIVRAALALVIAGVVYVAVQALRPAPSLELLPLLPASSRVPGVPPPIPWPTMGEAALAIGGVGMIGSSGGDTPLPLASVAKVMTAYVVLRDHPVAPGTEGPSLTVTPPDVATYEADRASGQSVVPVQAGEVLTERQALEALLLPSGNNIATMLATWDAGSVPAFVAKMNATARELGLRHTHYAGPSGLDPGSVGSAPDQVRLAEAAMRIPTFAEIVGMAQTTLPVAGVVYNVNALVGHDGIVGVKTGSTPQAGSSLVFAANRSVDGRPVQVFGAVLGQKGATPLATTFAETRALLSAATAGLEEATILPPRSPAARVSAPWGPSASAVTTAAVRFLSWPGMVVETRVKASRLGTTLPAFAPVGRLEVRVGAERATVGLVASRAVGGPPLSFRLHNL